MTWFDFLLNHGARPYQSAVTERPNVIRGLYFEPPPRFISESEPAYYATKNRDLYVDRISAFVCKVNGLTNGKVVARLVELFDHIFVDEVQDMCGYDLEFFDSLLRSPLLLTLVGDPRQTILRTNRGSKNKKYAGTGMVNWVKERSDVCHLEYLDFSYRCLQEICDFADALFPDLPSTVSRQSKVNKFQGIQVVSREEAARIYDERRPVVLRDNIKTDTAGLPAVNIGVAKGSTHDHVMVFCTGPDGNVPEEWRHRGPQTPVTLITLCSCNSCKVQCDVRTETKTKLAEVPLAYAKVAPCSRLWTRNAKQVERF